MAQVDQLVLARTILDSIIRDVVQQRIDNYEQLEETLRQVSVGRCRRETSASDRRRCRC
jgi:hypothetical protein